MEGNIGTAGFEMVAIGIEVGANLQVIDPELKLKQTHTGRERGEERGGREWERESVCLCVRERGRERMYILQDECMVFSKPTPNAANLQTPAKVEALKKYDIRLAMHNATNSATVERQYAP